MKIRAFTLASVVTVSATVALSAQVRDTTPPRPATPQTRDAQARDTAKPPMTGKSAISGVVVTDGQSPEPIKRAQVTVSNAEFTFTKTIVTTDTGKFSLANLPAGRYTLSATKPPFLRTAYGAKRYDRPGTAITLKDGEQMTDISLRMTRGGVLTGTILDENGSPAFGVSVRAMQLRVVNGERTFVAVASSGPAIETTDDRGSYRFFGLPPGEYAVSASPRSLAGEVKAMTETEIRAVLQALQQQTAAAQSQTQTPGSSNAPPPVRMPDPDAVTVSYASVYYPGTTSVTNAATVSLAPGDERRGVDFALKLVRTARIEGVVVAPPGIAPQSVQLMLSPATTGPAAAVEVFSFNRVAPGPDGKFSFTAVPPGDYQISARATPGGGGRGAGPAAGNFEFVRIAPPAGVNEPMPMMPAMMVGDGGSPFWGQADVSVNGTTISGVTIAMQPGMTVTGKVTFRGTRLVPDANLSRVRLTLTPAPVAGAGGARISMALSTAEVDETGNFKITGVTPGRYRLAGVAPIPQGSGPGMNWTLSSVIAKGRDVLDFPLEVGPNDEIRDVAVTFTDATQEISGTLQDATGRPAPDYTIIIFAAENRYWTSPTRRTRTARPGTDGRFTVSNLPPGEYRMAAVTDVSPTEVTDPSFLEQLVGASFKIALAEGEKKTQDLRISGGL